MCEAFRRGVGAVGSRKRVVYIKIAIDCQSRDEFRIVLFLALVETGVFQKQDIAVLQRIDGGLGLVADAVFGKMDTVSQNLGERLHDMRQRIFVRSNTFGATEMGEQNDLCAFPGKFGNGRNDALDTGQVCDFAIRHRHVEVNADQYALGLDVGIVESAETHDLSPRTVFRVLVEQGAQTGRRRKRVG